MHPLILEAILALAGLCFLVFGRLSLFPNRVVEGTIARFLGLVLLLPLPVSVLYADLYHANLPEPFAPGRTFYRDLTGLRERDPPMEEFEGKWVPLGHATHLREAARHLAEINWAMFGGASAITLAIFALASKRVRRAATTMDTPWCPGCLGPVFIPPGCVGRLIRCPNCQFTSIVAPSGTTLLPLDPL